MVARLEQPVNREIQAVCAVESKNDSIGTFRPKQLGRSFAAARDDALNLDGILIGSSTERNSQLSIIGIHGRIDGFGFRKAGRSVVEIDAFGLRHATVNVMGGVSEENRMI